MAAQKATPFIVLSDSGVAEILASLNKENVLGMLRSLIHTFIDSSLHGEQAFQPDRSHVERPDGQVTLFMPATSADAISHKIVGCPPPQPASVAQPKTLRSVLVLCDAEGNAKGVINAAELTAFRTSLGSMALYTHRRYTENIVIFGAGKQALWHARLALILRGSEIRKITIVNRSKDRSTQLVEQLRASASHVEFAILEPRNSDYAKALEMLLTEAQVIFCTTPAQTPLFPTEVLLTLKAQAQAPYLTAIGSYRPDMTEFHPSLLQRIVKPSPGQTGGKIFVDSRKGCFEESGEIIHAKLQHSDVTEVGELFGAEEFETKKMSEGIRDGLVVYKSVGMGVMDLTIAEALVRLSQVKGIGVQVDNF